MMKDEDLIPLSEPEIKLRLESLPDWKKEKKMITKAFEFESFTEAIQFINGLVMFCNLIDHHPDMVVSYKKVRFELTRFSVGGKITERDFTVAKKIEDEYQQYNDRKTS